MSQELEFSEELSMFVIFAIKIFKESLGTMQLKNIISIYILHERSLTLLNFKRYVLCTVERCETCLYFSTNVTG